MVALALPGQLGLGDVALASTVALNFGWLGWQVRVGSALQVLAALDLLAGLGLQSVAAVVARLRRRGGTMPMGPALVMGWLILVSLPG